MKYEYKGIEYKHKGFQSIKYEYKGIEYKHKGLQFKYEYKRIECKYKGCQFIKYKYNTIEYKHQGFQSIKYEYRGIECKHKGFQSVTYNDKRGWLSTDSKGLQLTKHRYKDCEQKDKDLNRSNMNIHSPQRSHSSSHVVMFYDLVFFRLGILHLFTHFSLMNRFNKQTKDRIDSSEDIVYIYINKRNS